MRQYPVLRFVLVVGALATNKSGLLEIAQVAFEIALRDRNVAVAQRQLQMAEGDQVGVILLQHPDDLTPAQIVFQTGGFTRSGHSNSFRYCVRLCASLPSPSRLRRAGEAPGRS